MTVSKPSNRNNKSQKLMNRFNQNQFQTLQLFRSVSIVNLNNPESTQKPKRETNKARIGCQGNKREGNKFLIRSRLPSG